MGFWPYIMRFFREKNEKDTLEDIVKGIQYAVNSAQMITERHYFNVFQRYFKGESEDEFAEPLTKTFLLSKDHKIEVPLVSLVQVNGVVLNNLKVRMAVKIEDVKHYEEEEEEKNLDLRKASFTVSLAPKESGKEARRPGNVIDLEMEFIAGEPPEAVARIIEKYTNQILPLEIEKSNNES